MENKYKRLIRKTEEAKNFMAIVRSKRGSKQKPVKTPSTSPISDQEQKSVIEM